MKRKKFVEDRWGGESLGLEHKYRLVKHKKRFVIFNYLTGEILEYIKKIRKESKFFYHDRSTKRLFEVNGLEMSLDDITKLEIDLIS